MNIEDAAEQWYPGHPLEKELFNDDAMGTPNERAQEIYAYLLETYTVKAERFYNQILKPFD